MKVDIRTKLLIVALFSILALAYQDPRMLAIILALNLLTVTLFRIPLSTFFKFKKFLSMYIILIIVQSFFVQGGDPLIKLGNLYFLTTEGILYGLSIILRFFILVGSGIILWQCNTAELLLALVKMRIPYEIVFMTQLGMRFIPVFINELQNIFNVIQLRGVDLRKVYKRKVINVYLSIFTPLIYSVWQ
ncbi:MAG: energy-coupling factor transporter transmembrane protein EcfT, partial [Firmicutes bacterium]|nr:energy-coupling factor transporter transmembrane protein EcfT [Bacillota bacterium]